MMFAPIPPESQAEPPTKRGKTLLERHKPDSLADPRCRTFFYGVVALQLLSAAFTFLPWSRFLGDWFAGYEAYSLELLYDGTAGKLNLLASALLVIGAIVVLRRRTNTALVVHGLATVAWNLVLTIWLVSLYNRLEDFRSFGLPLTIAAAVGTCACSLICLAFPRVRF